METIAQATGMGEHKEQDKDVEFILIGAGMGTIQQ